MHRSSRYPLSPHDQLFFLHIPKTGGTTLFHILGRLFSEAEIYSIRGLEPIDDTRLASASLIRAHAGYEIYRLFARTPVFLTMLRHPLARSVSVYMAARRKTNERPIPFEGTLEEFVTAQLADNFQTRRLAGNHFDLGRASSETLLAVAKAHLAQFPFFGITERFDDSLRLLCYTFDLEYPIAYASSNVSSADEKPALTPALEQKILEINALDLELYEFARTRFAERLGAMHDELGVPQR